MVGYLPGRRTHIYLHGVLISMHLKSLRRYRERDGKYRAGFTSPEDAIDFSVTLDSSSKSLSVEGFVIDKVRRMSTIAQPFKFSMDAARARSELGWVREARAIAYETLSKSREKKAKFCETLCVSRNRRGKPQGVSSALPAITFDI